MQWCADRVKGQLDLPLLEVVLLKVTVIHVRASVVGPDTDTLSCCWDRGDRLRDTRLEAQVGAH